MPTYRLKPGRLGKKILKSYRQIEKQFVDRFLEPDGSLKTGSMGRRVTGACRRVEKAVVGGYRKIEDAFVDAFLEETDDPHRPTRP